MLDSVKIQRRQSEIRQELCVLHKKDEPTEDEIRSMDEMDKEYRTNETRYRAALIAEDEERKEAGAELETRSDKEWNDLVDDFEVRQVALALDEGRQLEGKTAEVVSELRDQGGYRGMPVPWEALETRNTVSSDTPNPVSTRPIIDRLFPDSVSAQMGIQMINIGVGEAEWPVVTSNVTAGWAPTEGGNIPDPTQFTTVDRPMKPDHTMGVQMRISRKTLKQSGAALEQAVRRDMNGAMSQEMDRTVFQGSGSNGEPLGIMAGASTYGIDEAAVDTLAKWQELSSEIVPFLNSNAANGPGSVNGLFRPEMWNFMDNQFWSADAAITEWDRTVSKLRSAVISNNALPEPSGDPLSSSVLLTTNAGGVAPGFVGTWGAIDLIRDPYTDAQSGGLRLTALATMDLTVARPVQSRIVTGLQLVLA